MKYTGYTLSFQEVPGEASLAISISNCPFKCYGCHSKYLQFDVGEPLDKQTLSELINKYKSPHTNQYTIGCIVFFGGEQHHHEFIELANFVHSINMKVCLYTGAELNDVDPAIVAVCNYIKVGPYINTLGALSSKTTNQRMYTLPDYTDITNKFWEN